MTSKTFCLALSCVAFAVARPAESAPYALTAADRVEITALARSFFEATRDGTRDVQGVYPTPVDLRGLFPAARRGSADAGPSPADEIAQRQYEAIERDARALRETFQRGVFVGITATSYPRGSVDLRPCGRFARATTQCGDGPVIEYTVGSETRRFRLDTLVRLRGHWRVFDVRP
jgi:hypothetical protein